MSDDMEKEEMNSDTDSLLLLEPEPQSPPSSNLSPTSPDPVNNHKENNPEKETSNNFSSSSPVIWSLESCTQMEFRNETGSNLPPSPADSELERNPSQPETDVPKRSFSLPYFHLPNPNLDEFIKETEKNLDSPAMNTSCLGFQQRVFEPKDSGNIVFDLGTDSSKNKNTSPTSNSNEDSDFQNNLKSITEQKKGTKWITLRKFLHKKIQENKDIAFIKAKELEMLDENEQTISDVEEKESFNDTGKYEGTGAEGEISEDNKSESDESGNYETDEKGTVIEFDYETDDERSENGVNIEDVKKDSLNKELANKTINENAIELIIIGSDSSQEDCKKVKANEYNVENKDNVTVRKDENIMDRVAKKTINGNTTELIIIGSDSSQQDIENIKASEYNVKNEDNAKLRKRRAIEDSDDELTIINEYRLVYISDSEESDDCVLSDVIVKEKVVPDFPIPHDSTENSENASHLNANREDLKEASNFEIFSSLPSYQPEGGFPNKENEDEDADTIDEPEIDVKDIFCKYLSNIKQPGSLIKASFFNNCFISSNSNSPVVEDNEDDISLSTIQNNLGISLNDLPIANLSEMFSSQELENYVSGKFNSDKESDGNSDDKIHEDQQKFQDIFDNEAELSGEDDSKPEEDDNCNEDILDLGCDELLPEENLRCETADLHVKQTPNYDDELLKIIKEKFLDDGELNNDGKGRVRKYAGDNRSDKESDGNSDEKIDEHQQKVQDFFDNEAELSGEDDSEPEEDDKSDEDVLELFCDDELLPEENVRDEIADLHVKQMQNEDDEFLKQIKEKFLDDGELNNDGKGRVRKYAWDNRNVKEFSNASSSDDSDLEEDNDSSLTREKTKWQEQNKDMEINNSLVPDLLFDSKKVPLRLNIIHQAEKKNSEKESRKRKRGSFLNMAEEEASKILKKIKSDGNEEKSGSKTTKHFIYHDEEASTSKKK